ncbi:hypothetical protein [Isoptericola nanjingensis]|uniref:hypothetical protein n=1 Tax=Isoptericola TaxID=254250 RepID=UPI0035E9A23A|nr:hypothetical protein [Isoptericola sp. QY 916]
MDTFLAIMSGLAPSVGVGLLFWLAMRKILHADRNERIALERMDAEEAAAAAAASSESETR